MFMLSVKIMILSLLVINLEEQSNRHWNKKRQSNMEFITLFNQPRSFIFPSFLYSFALSVTIEFIHVPAMHLHTWLEEVRKYCPYIHVAHILFYSKSSNPNNKLHSVWSKSVWWFPQITHNYTCLLTIELYHKC